MYECVIVVPLNPLLVSRMSKVVQKGNICDHPEFECSNVSSENTLVYLYYSYS
jgi:exoribonuclease II